MQALTVKFNPAKKMERWIEGVADLACPICHQVIKTSVNTKPGAAATNDHSQQEPVFRSSPRGLEAIMIGDCKCGVTFEQVERVQVPPKS